MKTIFCASCVAAIAALSCGGNTTSVGASPSSDAGSPPIDGGASSSDAGTHPSDGDAPSSDAGTAADAAAAVTDITGTWDVYASIPRASPTMGTITITKDKLEILFLPHLSLTYAVQGNQINVIGPKGSIPMSVQRTAGHFDSGILPIDFGGAWDFNESGALGKGTCQATVGGDQNSAQCKDVDWSDTIGLDSPRSGARYSLVRRSVLASPFHALGGEWMGTDDQPNTGVCTLKVEGNTVSGGCQATSKHVDTTFELTIGDGVASGKTGRGGELSARRR